MSVDELKNIAKQFITDVNADGKVDVSDVVISMQKLLSDTSGKLDFGGLVSKLQNSDLSETVASWLGDGKNIDLSVDSLTKLFDSNQLNQFAQSLNIDLDTAKSALATAIPNLIDQISSGGNLLAKFSEHADKIQAEVAEVAEAVQAVATEKAEGLVDKIKKFFS